jgi:hypothetical protein
MAGHTLPVPPVLNTLPTLVVALAALIAAACGRSPTTLPHRAESAAPRTSSPRLPLRLAPDLVVKRVRFGTFAPSATGDDEFVPGTEIPAEDGQGFGWVVELDTNRESVHWQEHLRLPQAPADWGDASSDPDVLIAADGRSAVAQGDDLLEDGTLTRSYWNLAVGDPAGDYEMDVAIEGRAVGHVTFHVATAVKEKAMLVDLGRRGRRHLVRLVVLHDARGAAAWR